MTTLTLPQLFHLPFFSPSSSPSLSLLQTHSPTFSSHSPIINSKNKKASTILVFCKKDRFLSDEDGFVDEMEGYLQNLSLEYDSVWDTKPSWCQPWTITLTGVSVIATSWFILKSIPVTSFISLLIGAWWFIFLYSYPKVSYLYFITLLLLLLLYSFAFLHSQAYSQMIAERRQKVSNGLEDTFGVTKNQ